MLVLLLVVVLKVVVVVLILLLAAAVQLLVATGMLFVMQLGVVGIGLVEVGHGLLVAMVLLR